MKKSTVTTKSNANDRILRGGFNRGRRVCVVGGGIGGLTAALAFAHSGAHVRVFEQAASFAEVGAGIQVTPNAMRALLALGITDAALNASSIVARGVEPVDAMTGRAIARFDLSRQVPAYRFFHRASLIGLIGRAAQDAGAEVSFGVRVASVSRDGMLNTTTGHVPSDLCIGADGIHSVTRSFLGNAEAPDFTGQVAWRATIKAHVADPKARIWMAPHRHVVTYPLRDDILNIVAIQERTDWAEEGWKHEDDPTNLRAVFADTCPELREILDNVGENYLWGLFRHPVAKHWHSDRVAILGDAAHPTLPFLAQGANLAIEDAYVLSRACDGTADLNAAFAQYQALRAPRVTRAIAAADANARNYHLDGMTRRAAHMGLKIMGKIAPDAFINRLDWLYGYDVTR